MVMGSDERNGRPTQSTGDPSDFKIDPIHSGIVKMLVLLSPSEIDENQYHSLMGEFMASGEILVPSVLDAKGLAFHEYAQTLEDHSRGLNLPENHVPASTYFLADTRGYLHGAVNIRHGLNDFLRTEGGHIGYGIRPSSRGNGYGTKILALALEKAKELNINPVLVTCDKDNFPSAAIIQKNGGVMDSEIEINNHWLQRYWIMT